MDNIIEETIKGVKIRFKTKPGIFSKGRFDLGSKLLFARKSSALFENIELPERGLIADLGCGTGVIGFTAAKLAPKAHIHLLDVNLRTVELAKENAELNRLKNVEIYLSDQFSAVPERTYNLILSNPAQHLGNEFLEETGQECFNHLKKGGEVYWVVQRHLKPFVQRLFENIFGEGTIIATGKDHIIIKGVKGL